MRPAAAGAAALTGTAPRRRPGVVPLESARDMALAMPGRWGVEPGPRLLGPADGISAAVLDARPGEVWTHPGDAHTLSYVVRGEAHHRQWHDNRQVHDGPVPDRSVNVVPAGVAPRAVCVAPITVLHVYLPHADLVRRAATAGWGGRGGALEIIDPRFAPDPHLEGLAALLAGALGAPCGRHDRLYLDGLTGAVAARVLQRWSNLGPAVAERHKGGLAPHRLRRALDHMEARLGEDLGLADLASAAAMSPFGFARAFKASTGLPPHRYMMGRRVERAKEMLRASELGVTEVALACGFASPQHMATAFRRFGVGAAPGAYRREHQS